MRRFAPLFLCICLSTPLGPNQARAHARMMEPAPEDPAALYQQGQERYQAGDFQGATAKWEQAYAASQNPLILYNLGKAYRALFEEGGDANDLRRADRVLSSLQAAIDADPTIGDADEIAQLREDVSTKLKAIDAASQAITQPEPEPEPEPELEPELEPEPEAVPEGPEPQTFDRGQPLRRAGIATIATGGVLVVVGGAVGAIFMLRGRDTTDQLDSLYIMRNMGVEVPETELDTLRTKGKNANLAAGLSLGLAGGLGVAAIVAGAVLWKKGSRDRSQVSLLPGPGSLTLSGRF